MISTAATVLCRAVTVPPTSTPAGWFPDPLQRYEHRYFNGASWTADVSDGGQRFVDPLGIEPGPAPVYQGSAAAERNGLATAALVCGIVAAVLAWMPFIVVIGIALAIVAIVLGVRGLRRSATTGSGRGPAITGIVTGIVALALAVVGIVLSIVVYRAIDNFIDPGPVEAEVSSCTIDGANAIVDGELTNESSSTRNYTVFVSLDERTRAITIDGVEPGETVSWSATIRAPGDGDCDAQVDVQGPFPFGIELDPVDG